MARRTRTDLTVAQLAYRCDISGISQHELARVSGIHQPNISLILRQERTPKPDTLKKLVTAYYDICDERGEVE